MRMPARYIYCSQSIKPEVVCLTSESLANAARRGCLPVLCRLQSVKFFCRAMCIIHCLMHANANATPRKAERRICAEKCRMSCEHLGHDNACKREKVIVAMIILCAQFNINLMAPEDSA